MSRHTQRHRDEVFTRLGRMLPEQSTYQVMTLARALLAAGTTFQRLSEAQCNGDWPCDNGERKVKPCARCDGGYVPSVLKKGGLCPDCRLTDRVTALCKEYGLTCTTQGDPRGAVFIVKGADGAELVIA